MIEPMAGVFGFGVVVFLDRCGRRVRLDPAAIRPMVGERLIGHVPDHSRQIRMRHEHQSGPMIATVSVVTVPPCSSVTTPPDR